jgi:hypothetical protein
MSFKHINESIPAMSDFIFDVSAPAIDHHMVSLIDPQLTFAASGNNEWKDQHIRQLGWNVVDLPDDLFSSSEHAATIRRLFLVFQGAIQYCKFRERQAVFEAGQFKSKLKSSKKEVSDLFDELVELREATALMRLGSHHRQNGGAVARRRGNDDRRETLEERRGFSCYLCGNSYPSSGPLQSHLKKRHSISAELAQKASASCGVDVYQTAIELQKNEILREREEARARELNDLKTEVTHVRLAMSDMATKQGTEAHREIEFSREVLSTSILQVQKILAAAAVAAATPPPPPQPAQVVLTQQQPAAGSNYDDMLLSKLDMQERRVRELEGQLQQRRSSTPTPLVPRDVNHRTPQPEGPPTTSLEVQSHKNNNILGQPTQRDSAPMPSIMRRVSKRYDEVSEDDQSSSLAGSPDEKSNRPHALKQHNHGRSLLAPVPILLKLPRSPTTASTQQSTSQKLDRPSPSSDGPRQSSSTIEETKSLVSPISPPASAEQQQAAGAEQTQLRSHLLTPVPAAPLPTTAINTSAPLPQLQDAVDQPINHPQRSAEHLSEFVNVEVSQMSLPSKKEGGGNDAANRSDTVNMESQRISVDGPIVSSASSTTNHNPKAASSALQQMNQHHTTSSSDESDSSSDSSSSSSSSDDESGMNRTAAAAVTPTETAVKTNVKKPSLFSRFIAKVTS